MTEDNIGCIGCFMYISIFIAVIGLSILFTKTIVNSDLPEWVKFFLLR